MSNKPKTLHEQLMELANWLNGEGAFWYEEGYDGEAEIYYDKATEVRAMAERVKGKALVKVVFLLDKE